MKSSTLIKSKSPKPNISNLAARKPKKYLNKNLSKKYIYKKEKATDTDKVLQNNKISKNIVLSPIYNKGKEIKNTRHILNNSNCDLRSGLEIRDDVNIDYDQYQRQQSSYLNSPTISTFNPTTINTNIMNQSYILMNKKNRYMANTNRANKWKCAQCGNVNSNFNYLCNNCNMPNTNLDPNNSLLINQRNNSTGKNLEAISLDKNLINNSFNNNSINTSSQNLFTKNISNNIMKKQLLKKNNTNANLSSNIANYSTSNLLNPFYSNMGFNTIRHNKNNNNNYFYSGANVNLNNSNNNSISSNNIFEPERDSNITNLYSYSNYLANELRSSNDTNIKLLENYQTNESEYNSNYQQNDLIKKKIKILKEKENQLDKINEQLEKSLAFIKDKYDDKKMDSTDGNLNAIKAILGHNNIDEFKTKISQFNEENEKLSDKLKENKDIIIKLKSKIGELSDDKKNKNLNINLENQKINTIKDLKEKISNCSEEIKKQNQEYISLDSENKALEQKIKLLKKQINDDEKENNNKNSNEIKSVGQIKSIPISMNNDTDKEKEKYLKAKEQNNQLSKFFNELNKMQNCKKAINKNKKEDENNIFEEIYLGINKNCLDEILNDEENKKIIENIKKYANLLNDRTE